MSTVAFDAVLEAVIPVSTKVKEDLLHAAVSGHADEILYLLERHPVPTEWRNMAHSLAISGGHYQAADILKPSLH